MNDEPVVIEKRIVRYTLRERVIHWLSGLSYVYLLLSGLAFYAPQLYWISYVLGGPPTARFWHPWMGLLFMAVMIWMHTLWRADMQATEADRRWNRQIRKYVENRDEEVPAVDRFNPGQKQFYWAMFLGAIVLLFSGFVMWAPEFVPYRVRGLRPLAIVVHEVAALVTIGAFMIHVYMGVFVVSGGFNAIVHGYVSPLWAKTHHRLWFDRISGNTAPRK